MYEKNELNKPSLAVISFIDFKNTIVASEHCTRCVWVGGIHAGSTEQIVDPLCP